MSAITGLAAAPSGSTDPPLVGVGLSQRMMAAAGGLGAGPRGKALTHYREYNTPLALTGVAVGGENCIRGHM